MKLRLFLLFYVFPFILLAQSEISKNSTNEDFIQKALATSNTSYLDIVLQRKLSSYEKMDIYSIYGQIELQKGNTDTAKKYFDSLLKESEHVENIDFQLTALINLGDIYYIKEDYDKTKEYYRKTKSVIEKMPKNEEIGKLTALADSYLIYYLNGDFEIYIQKMQALYKSLEALEKNEKDKKQLKRIALYKAYFLNVIAKSYIMLKNYQIAEVHINKADQFLRTMENHRELMIEVDNQLQKGKIAFFRKDFSTSIKFLNDVANRSAQMEYKEFFYKSQIYLSMNYFNLDSFSKSLKYSENAIKNKIAIIDYLDYDFEAIRYAYLASKKMNLKDNQEKYSQAFFDQHLSNNKISKRRYINEIIRNEYVEEGNQSKNKLLIFSLIVLIALIVVFVFFNHFQRKRYKRNIEEIKKKYFSKEIVHTNNEEEKYNDKKIRVVSEKVSTAGYNGISKETIEKILKKLSEFEQQELYLKKSMSLASLASYAETNTLSLSSIINRSKNSNFNDYINGLRIEYVIKKLKEEPIYRTYKISYLAEICGFSSHSLFTRSFHKHTKINPSEFIKIIENEEST